ncbi:coth protein-domain-containing protein [Pilaira anomala]|nr:coth protein-domain-containing protein [Pilaira anomala]
MKLIIIATGLASIAFTLANAVDVTYTVIAFPGSGDSVSVNVGQKDYPLKKSPLHGNLFTGTAPFGTEYRYKVGQKAENATRHLTANTTSTGNEFFGRSRTVYDIPAIKSSFNPIYPAFDSAMNRDNEISTLILNADMKAIDKFLQKPTDYNNKWAEVYNMSYISHDAIYSFQGAGIKNSGQSSREMAKQSLKIKFNKFNNATKDRLFNRRDFKLRAQANDPSMTREKLMMDTLAATGAATLSSNWVRLFVNSEPFGLFLMSDDSFKGFTDNFLNGGSAMNSTGLTIKANAMDPNNESNMVYNGTDPKGYNFRDVYMLEEEGKGKTINETNYMYPLIEFMEKLNKTARSSNAQTPGNINEIIDSPDHTMIQIAMSFLSGSWDGLWRQASNFYFHQNRETKKWYVISYDFDETFGNGLQEDLELMTTPYNKYARPDSRRPLIDAFIKDPYYQPKFEEILKTIVKRSFNPRVLKPRLEAWAKMLKEDVAWDRSLPFRSPGNKEKFSADDLSNMFTTVYSRVGVLEWVSNRTTSLCKQLNFTDVDDLTALPTYKKQVPNPTA